MAVRKLHIWQLGNTIYGWEEAPYMDCSNWSQPGCLVSKGQFFTFQCKDNIILIIHMYIFVYIQNIEGAQGVYLYRWLQTGSTVYRQPSVSRQEAERFQLNNTSHSDKSSRIPKNNLPRNSTHCQIVKKREKKLKQIPVSRLIIINSPHHYYQLLMNAK